MKRFLVGVGALALAGCTDGPDARRVLEENGFTQVHTGGHAGSACDSGSDVYATRFTAVAPSGHVVSGAVCKGWFKGSTIRFE